MSLNTPGQTLSDREKILSAKLQEAESQIAANARREAGLLVQLLEAKTALLHASQQREQQLLAQLQDKSAELELCQKTQQHMSQKLEESAVEIESLKMRIEDPSAEAVEKENALKETALKASRNQERILATEIRELEKDIDFLGDKKNSLQHKVSLLEADLECSRDKIAVLSDELTGAKKTAGDFEEKTKQLSEKLQQVEVECKAGRSREEDLQRQLDTTKKPQGSLIKWNGQVFGSGYNKWTTPKATPKAGKSGPPKKDMQSPPFTFNCGGQKNGHPQHSQIFTFGSYPQAASPSNGNDS
ncbi:hypothetical protein FHETE_2348 [Fusarium heterosporum]|uniref:Uncharacterized protein n=1 Tax=Fusarium heterosporum TaxID=42747 RepID=A0A8H5TUY8_FUSHE|nr:hypothetical protein FHETE_2348 [Fusarium heterosporum]